MANKRVNRIAGARPFGRVSLIRHMLHSINSLEAQLSVLKAQLAPDVESEQVGNRFAGLHGVLSGKSDSTDEDIRTLQYHLDSHKPWER